MMRLTRRMAACAAALLLLALAVPAGASISSKWTRVWSPNPGSGNQLESRLIGISCVGAEWCWSVGYATPPDPEGPPPVPIAELWSGDHWTAKELPHPMGGGTLSNVSCASRVSCIAVGRLSAGSAEGSMIWNGTTWTIVPFAPFQEPNDPYALVNDQGLTAVSCVSANWCMAVGAQGGSAQQSTAPIAQRWNGKNWAMVSIPIPGPPEVPRQAIGLDAISCVSRSFCEAVGTSYDQKNQVTVAERWNGMHWVHQTSSDTSSRPNYDQPNAISCASSARCTAVGSQGAQGHWEPLALRFNGTVWALLQAPRYSLPIGSSGWELNGVTCRSSTTCLCVGDDTFGSIVLSVVGSSWKSIPSYSSSIDQPTLFGVACSISYQCLAAGNVAGGTLAERNF